MTKRVACHWTNRQPIGSPPKFEVTGWTDPKPKKKAESPQSEFAL